MSHLVVDVASAAGHVTPDSTPTPASPMVTPRAKVTKKVWITVSIRGQGGNEPGIWIPLQLPCYVYELQEAVINAWKPLLEYCPPGHLVVWASPYEPTERPDGDHLKTTALIQPELIHEKSSYWVEAPDPVARLRPWSTVRSSAAILAVERGGEHSVEHPVQPQEEPLEEWNQQRKEKEKNKENPRRRRPRTDAPRLSSPSCSSLPARNTPLASCLSSSRSSMAHETFAITSNKKLS
jgi:hypothetical protein